MKVIASGDHHWDLGKRWLECQRVHDFIAALVRREKPDLFISAGDIYERASLPDERLAVAGWLTAIAEVCPVLIVKGNHDSARDCALLAQLRTRHPITVEEGASVHVIAGAAIAAVAWPERARILQHARDEADETSAELVAEEALRNVFRGLGAQLADYATCPRLAVGHFMVDGSVTSVGQPLIGQPMHVGTSDLALLEADIVIMGHIHKPQEFQHGSTPMLYTGSPFRTSYGETEEKSVLLVEYRGANLVKWQRIPTPCARMFLVTDAWNGDDGCFEGAAVMHVDPDEVPGAEIRMRYTVAPDQRDAARAIASHWRDEWLALGASDVKVEESVETSTRARAPEVAAALTLGDKLLALWRARDTTPESPRKEVLIELAQGLEQDETA